MESQALEIFLRRRSALAEQEGRQGCKSIRGKNALFEHMYTIEVVPKLKDNHSTFPKTSTDRISDLGTLFLKISWMEPKSEWKPIRTTNSYIWMPKVRIHWITYYDFKAFEKEKYLRAKRATFTKKCIFAPKNSF